MSFPQLLGEVAAVRDVAETPRGAKAAVPIDSLQ